MNTPARTLLLLIALTHLPAAGQEPTDATREDVTPPAQDAEPQPAEPAPTATEASASNNSSPSDYRASEQISEDLSVSFPVDI